MQHCSVILTYRTEDEDAYLCGVKLRVARRREAGVGEMRGDQRSTHFECLYGEDGSDEQDCEPHIKMECSHRWSDTT